MSGRSLAMLVVSLLAVSSGGQSPASNSVDVEVDVSFDPCEGHDCPAGEVCKVVVSPRLLQFPVARCVEKFSASGDGPCKTHTIGSNILNCKTEREWNGIARIQCMFRGGTTSLRLEAVQVQHACHSRTNGDTRFLSVEFKCCSAGPRASGHTESTTHVTATTQAPAQDSSQQPTTSSLPVTSQESPPGNEEHQEEITTTSLVGSSATSTVVQENVVSVFYPSYITVLLVLVVASVVIGVVCAIGRKKRSAGKRESLKATPTVYINPNCEGHHVKHSYSADSLLSFPDLSQGALKY